MPLLRDRLGTLWPHWYELLPEVIVVGGLAFFLIDEPDAATSALDSLRAVGLIVGVTIAWLLGRIVLARVAPWPVLRLTVFAVAAFAILWVVVFPAYDETTVIEAFPDPALMADEQPIPDPPASSEPVGPLLRRTAQFEGIDHRASGTVSIYQRDNGAFVVGLERFDIQPGPDYDVYVVPGGDREGRADGTLLDDLRGNQGTQYYEVPARLSLDDGEWTVLIWCETFGVPVANSTPQPA